MNWENVMLFLGTAMLSVSSKYQDTNQNKSFNESWQSTVENENDNLLLVVIYVLRLVLRQSVTKKFDTFCWGMQQKP